MSKYLLHDVQALLRGIRSIAETGFKHQAAEINQRLCNSSLRPLAQSVWNGRPSKSSSPTQGFNVQEMASRAGAVLQGIQEQVKIVTGFSHFSAPSPVLAFDGGHTLYSDKIGRQQNKASRDHPTTASALDGNGNGKPEGEAGEAAKRAEKFMNPPVAPLDDSSIELQAEPDQSLEGDDPTKLKNFMREETTRKDDKYNKDARKTFIDGGGDSAIRIEDIKKLSKVPPGVPIKADSNF